ncbi:polyprenyl synthetase family protein [Microbispora sp. RL4-1S]|uniref:Polyprenyl synthetase family protein n=1 Tax=Microbispora oryzae TaxID=2806554 RepID=A0A940WMX7_9ACTN|nr:polyprenyl synthetase family protein [Microbispora oryzae]MBP2705963.1 polyprenyl synthetase family protein [Microbispora oryzae]
MTSENVSHAFPALESDLERVRELVVPADSPRRSDVTAPTVLIGQPAGARRRLIRPTLTLLSYYVFAGPERATDVRAVKAAAAVELLHMASLYHDDVIDDARQRRGRPSANSVWGARMAVLAGDLLFVNGSRIVAELGRREALVVTEAIQHTCAGAIAETADRFRLSRTEEAYLEVTGAKTAELLSLACRLGAMQAGQGPEAEEAIARFGWHLGLAYQVRDDVLDLTATTAELGKPANSDIMEGVYTLPVIRALAREPALARLLRHGVTAADAEAARRLVLSCGAVDEAREVAATHLREAIRRLDGLGDPRSREGLAGYARSVLNVGERADPPPVSVPAPSPVPLPVPAGELERVQERLNAWLLDTGLAATPEEARHPRWSGMAAVAARFWPDAGAERVETLARWMVMFALLDDLFDEPGLTDPADVVRLRRRLTLLVRGLDDGPPSGGAVATGLAQAWERIRLIQSPAWRTRAIGHLLEWLEAAEREACHRLSGFVPSLRDQLPLRLGSAGVPVFLDSFEITCGREFEPELHDHPLLRRLLDLGTATMLAENDLRTFDEDEAVGAPYNLVRVLRHETGCGRREAIDEVTRQIENGHAQVDAILTAGPAILGPAQGGSGSTPVIGLLRMIRDRLPGWRAIHDIDRYSRSSAGSETYLARLRRELLLEYAETGAGR